MATGSEEDPVDEEIGADERRRRVILQKTDLRHHGPYQDDLDRRYDRGYCPLPGDR